MSSIPDPDDRVQLVVLSPTHIRAHARPADPSGGPGRLLGIARRHGNTWSVVYRGGGQRLYFGDEMQVRLFLLALADDVDPGTTEASSGPGGDVA